MKSTSYININKTPKAFKIFLIIIPLVAFAIFIGKEVDNDFYFLYPTGEYVLNNGFPTRDFLTWHSNMSIIVQQWMSAVIFFLVGSKLKMVGLIALEYICVSLFYCISYKVCKLVSENFLVSYICSASASVFISIAFITTRPQIFTYIFLLIEIYVLESFVKTKKPAVLIVLPVISLALVNFHSSMWLMLFVFMVPYILNAVPVNFKRLRQQPCCSLAALLVAFAVSFAAGFINPYGTKAMFYLFSSYGYSTINNYIQEMLPLTVNDSIGKAVFLIVIIVFVLVKLYKAGRFETRHLLMFIGTLYLGVSSLKSLPYLTIGLMLFCASYFKDFTFSFKINEDDSKKSFDYKKVGIVFAAMLVVCGASVFYMNSANESAVNGNEASASLEEESETAQLDVIIEYLNNENAEDMCLFNGFNSGPYLEYRGVKTFMDARAELFFEKNNHEFDYYNEMLDAEDGKIYYKDYFDKYGFTHLVISKKTYVLYNSLIYDENYQEVISEKDYSLFVKSK